MAAGVPNLLRQVIGSGESLVAVGADVWPLLGMRAHVPSRPNQSALICNQWDGERVGAKRDETSPGGGKENISASEETYRFKCSRRLNSRPQLGIGHEWDL